ncbi:hypothetical protein [Desulforamulus ferrireducens]|uniref:Uncharacterized protein n=1 Tax=Desulforamulus ferrireducens TaxID=1833852 RepID=A0A1S6ITW6_9FIRM|nr:hypothetical protein [Desulforamulus ferrireducens]AQS58212.1 hypothetical protein B0537_03335 [Desulforamulus ferrireducens]
MYNASIQQLQERINHLQNDLSQIQQICSQLQQSEQQNSQQLQQMSQREANAAQQLQRVNQTAQHMSQEISQVASYQNMMNQPNQFSNRASSFINAATYQPSQQQYTTPQSYQNFGQQNYAATNQQSLNAISNMGQYGQQYGQQYNQQYGQQFMQGQGNQNQYSTYGLSSAQANYVGNRYNQQQPYSQYQS